MFHFGLSGGPFIKIKINVSVCSCLRFDYTWSCDVRQYPFDVYIVDATSESYIGKWFIARIQYLKQFNSSESLFAKGPASSLLKQCTKCEMRFPYFLQFLSLMFSMFSTFSTFTVSVSVW